MLRDGSMDVEASWCGVDVGRGHDEQCETVHRRLKRIVRARGALDAQEAEALREADRLGVWRWYGYGSLVEYMEMELGHTPRAAAERIRVAKAIVELPAIDAALSQGALSFSAARELTRVATPDTEQVWLEAAHDKNLRDIEQLVSGHKKGDGPEDPPDPTLRTRALRYDDVDEETIAILRQARQILDRELGERLDNNQFLRALGRTVIEAASVKTEGRARTRAPYQIAVTTCDRCKRAWQDGGGITVEMSTAKHAAAECDAQHVGRVDSDVGVTANERQAGDAISRGNANEAVGTPREQARAPGPDTCEAPQQPARAQRAGMRATPGSRARTTIPPALRRKVSARDHGRCRVPWCRSYRNVDQHHIRPVAEGGEDTLENLISLCESHHIALHEGALVLEGDAVTARFTRRAQSGVEAISHAVETAQALRTLGFRKDEANAAMEKARAHVGTAQLTLEQWIKIALSYCPRPLG